jgi:hypothetical protein
MADATSSTACPPLVTIDDYLTLERAAVERHEYLNGCVMEPTHTGRPGQPARRPAP